MIIILYNKTYIYYTYIPQNNSVDLPRVPYLQEIIWLFRPISGLISTSRVVIPRHGQPGLNENWSNKAINLSKESETKKYYATPSWCLYVQNTGTMGS